VPRHQINKDLHGSLKQPELGTQVHDVVVPYLVVGVECLGLMDLATFSY